MKNLDTNILFIFIKKNKPLVAVLFFLFMLVLLLIPKIYLRNNIYYISKDISKLYSQYISLKEENSFLEQQLENKEYENQITDSLILNDLKLLSNK